MKQRRDGKILITVDGREAKDLLQSMSSVSLSGWMLMCCRSKAADVMREQQRLAERKGEFCNFDLLIL